MQVTRALGTRPASALGGLGMLAAVLALGPTGIGAVAAETIQTNSPPLGTYSQQELTAADRQPGDAFGGLVAIDGSTLAVGAPSKNSNAGSAYVFVRSGGTWSQQAQVTASDAVVGDQFGSAFEFTSATADEQPELLVGAQGKNSSSGAVYVFTRSGSSWLQLQELTPSDGKPNDLFGYDAKVSGSSLVVVAPGKASNTGAAYVFVRSGQRWIQKAELAASDGKAGDLFGYEAAISGSTVVVGAPTKNANSGAAYVFGRVSGTWIQQQELTAPDPAAFSFGRYVVAAGSTIVVGAAGLGGGVAYVFTRTGAGFGFQQRLQASDKAPNSFFALAMAIDDSTLVVGSPGKNSNTGATYVFTRGDAGWIQQAEIVPSDGAPGDYFGVYVAVERSTVLVGAPFHAGAGAAYVFRPMILP